MSTSLADLPRSLRGRREVEDLVAEVTRSKTSASKAREKAKHSVSPGRATVDIQLGALCHGAIEGVVGDRLAAPVQVTTAIVALGAGLYLGSPDAVLFANGLAAPLSSAQGYKLVTLAKGGSESWPQAK